jgi:hypothetical protein
VAYRPSHAGFDLNAGSAFAGVLPASFQAAVIGSGLTLAWIAAAAVIADGLPDPIVALQMALGGLMVAILPIIIATVLCAIYIGVVGVPIAALLGARLDTPAGLAVAVGAALATGLAAMVVFGFRPLFGEVDWPFALMVFAYALPAGLLYRRAVIDARMLNPFADPAA